MPKFTAIMSSDRHARLVSIFLLALLIFNFPVLRIFGKNYLVLGMPMFYFSLFISWLGIIGLIFWNTGKSRKLK